MLFLALTSVSSMIFKKLPQAERENVAWFPFTTLYHWEFQDPKMEVLYHIRPYFVGIFPYISLI